MQLFRKPNWLRPEINEPKYWVHLAILATMVLGLLQYFKGGEMLTIMNVAFSIPLLAAGDLVAHTLLKLD